jgi:hypothetical protein
MFEEEVALLDKLCQQLSEWFEDRSSDYFEKVVDEFVADVKDVIDEPMRTELIDKMIHIPYEDLSEN